jgi:hypothetical protein
VDLLPAVGRTGGRLERRRRQRRTRLLVSGLTVGAVEVLGSAVALAANVTHSDETSAVRSEVVVSSPSPVAASTPSVVKPSAVRVVTPRVVPSRTKAPTRKPAPVVRPTAPVLVLNNSTVRGLAARSAQRVRNVGFAVRRVGNLYGRHARTTVYYRPGYADQAWLLAGSLRGTQDVHPAPSWLPGGTPVTLVVTRDFA